MFHIFLTIIAHSPSLLFSYFFPTWVMMCLMVNFMYQLYRGWRAQRIHDFWVCLGRCFWMGSAFELMGPVKQVALPRGDGPHSLRA